MYICTHLAKASLSGQAHLVKLILGVEDNPFVHAGAFVIVHEGRLALQVAPLEPSHDISRSVQQLKDSVNVDLGLGFRRVFPEQNKKNCACEN